MEPSVVVAIIGAIEAIGVAVIGGLISRNQKRSESAQKAREERDSCLYNLMFATASGTEVLLHQAHGEQLNGNVEDALRDIQNAKAKCNSLFNHHMAKL